MLKHLINEIVDVLADMYIKDTSCDGQLFCGCREEDCEAHGTKECRVCLLKQVKEQMKEEKQIDFDNLAPSWYIYTDAEGIAHSETYGQITEDQFFTKVSKRIAFDDITDETVQKIYYKGKEVEYVGWQPCMKYEYKDLDGNTFWVGNFPEWDH